MLRPLLELLAGELSGHTCMDHVHMITRYHRIQASPGYRAAAQECLAVLQGAGVESRIVPYPATGRHWQWANLTPQEWACRDAELWVVGPDGARLERLAWFQEMNLSLIQRSDATPPEGITAELAVVDDAESAAAWHGRAVAGKIVLVGNGDIHRMLQHAQSAGAVGLITARMTYHPPVRPEGDLADALQYTSFWWSPETTRGWGFVVSTATGGRLRALLSRGTVRLWARVDAHAYDGTIENVEAVIPGTTEEEVQVIAHLCHPKPSANDNATGPATVMEAARTLNRLITDGRLAPPRRSIRFILPPEMTGTYAHLESRTPAEIARIAAALNVDMVGQKQEVTGSVLLCEYPPVACPSFAGDLLALVLAAVAEGAASIEGEGPRYARFRHAVVPFAGGSDHYIMADPTVGVPCPMIIQWPDRFYHTSDDTPDKVDPAMMRRVGLMTAVYAYFAASAGPAEAEWLATEMAALFPAQLHQAVARSADPEAAAGFRLDRKLADLQSLRRLAGTGDPAFEATLDLCLRQVTMSAEMELQRTSPATSAPADLQTVGTVAGWTGAADLAALHPVRCQPGPVSLRHHLDRLPTDDQESWHAFDAAHPGASGMANYLCYWADGERSLADIVRLTALETGRQNDVWALGYCQLLTRLALMTGA